MITKPRLTVALLLAGSLLMPTAPLAQDAGQGAATGPVPWASRCSSEGKQSPLECVMEQRVVVSNTGQLMAAVTVRQPAGAAPVMMVQVPFGLYLPAGLKMAVGGRNFETLPLQTCDGQGCFAGSTISNELLAALRAGETLELTFQDQAQRDIIVPVSLAGFSAALTRIQ